MASRFFFILAFKIPCIAVFAQVPVIASFSPESGPVGTTVQILGTNFSATAEDNIVYFGAGRAIVTAATTTVLTVTVPAGATYQPITVLTHGLIAYSPKPFTVTFNSIPGINTSSFSRTQHTPGGQPWDIVMADLDADGKTDFATLNPNHAGISFFRNTSVPGTPTFDRTDISIRIGISGLTFGDLDADGKSDLVFFLQDTVVVYKNTSLPGNVSFTFALKTQFNGIPRMPCVRDLDGDGKAELIVVNSYFSFYPGSANTISVFRNTTAGGIISFAAPVEYALSGSESNSVDAGDLDGDNKPEIVLVTRSTNSMSVFRNTCSPGTISFDARMDFAAGFQSTGVRMADIDNDGKLDVITTSHTNDGSQEVFRNTSSTGSISFSKTELLTPTNPRFAAVGDLDGDGKVDLAVGTNSALSLYKNNSTPGNVTFASAVNFAIDGSRAGAVGDLDNDGKPDVAVASILDNNVSVFRNLVLTRPPAITSFSPQSGPIGTTVTITGTDFNTTPNQNVVFFGATKATVTSATTTSLTVNVPVGATYDYITVTNLATNLTAYASKQFTVTTPGHIAYASKQDFNSGRNSVSVEVADFDGDGKSDLAAVNTGSVQFSLSIFRNNGTVGAIDFATKTDIFTSANTPFGIAVADIDVDGKPDIALTHYTGYVSTFRNTSSPGTISFVEDAGFTPPGSEVYSIAMNDIDGDGKPDLAISFANTNIIAVYRNRSAPGAFGFAPAVTFATASGGQNRALNLGDIDGDAKPDLVTVNQQTHTASVFQNASTPGSINFINRIDVATGLLPRSVVIGDMDGDGKPDLAIPNSSSNTISLFRNTSSGAISFAARVDLTTGNGPRLSRMGDLDGDGKPELIVPNYSSNTVSVFRNTSSSGTLSFDARIDFQTGTNPYSATLGDISGDGKLDLITPNYGSNTVSVFRQIVPVVVSSFTPSSGCAGTASVVITGSGFARANRVTIGGTDVLNYTVDSSTQITATVASGTSGVIAVTADNTGTSAGTFTVNYAPAQPGTISGDVTAYFGASKTYSIVAVTDATSYTWTLPSGWTGTSATNSINVTVGAASGNISVTANNACGASTAQTLAVSAVQVPVVSSFSPQSGPIGTTVTITGTGFNTTPALNDVVFGSTRANVTAASATSLTVTVPVGATYQPFWVTNLANNLTGYSPKPFMVTQPGGLTYLSRQRIFLNQYPRIVGLGDFDNDGKSDLAVTTSGSIEIFRNNGAPGTVSFEDPIEVSSELEQHALGIADFDGDGKSDVVTFKDDASSREMRYFLNTTVNGGAISFSSYGVAAADGGALHLSIGDLDGDGKPDYAAPFLGAGFGIYHNESSPGSIAFGAVQKIRPNNNSNLIVRVIIGDLDGDSKPDLLALNSTASTLHAYRNTSTPGSITFAPKVDFPLMAGVAARMPFIGDLDGDDRPDLAISNNTATNISVYRNTSTAGSINFDTSIEFPAGAIARSLTEGDLDGDGKADLVVPGLNDGRTTVIRNISTVGAMNFEAPLTLPGTAALEYFAAIGDLDGDKKPDIITANGLGASVATNTLSIFRQYTPVVVSSFTPSNGCAGTGTVVITGSGFERTTNVTIGGTPVLNFTVDSPTQITATVGNGTSGVIEVTADVTGSSAGTFTVNNIPVQPTSINGDAVICVGDSKTYSIAVVTGATSYTWTLPSGWTGTSTTNSIDVIASSTSGTISVIASNTCGSSTAQTLEVTVNSIPAQPDIISGDVVICADDSKTYGVASVNGATSYMWTLPSGWTGSSTANLIDVIASAASGTVSVTADNMCGSSPARTLPVTVNSIPSQPGVINGDAVLCAGDSETYDIASVSGATSYTWILPGVWAGASTTNSINATTDASSGNVSVTADNMCGSSVPQTLPVIVNTIPAQPDMIDGDVIVCSGDSETYSIASVNGAGSYTWKLPGGWTGTSIINSINATANASSGNISVTADNMCGSSPVQTIAITVNSIPAQPTGIDGDAILCTGDSENYSIASVAGAASYTWTLPDNWTGTSTTTSIRITANTTSGNISVSAINDCGSSSAQVLPVTVVHLPQPIITVNESNESHVLFSNSDTGNQWFLDGEVISGATGKEYQTTEYGNYQVQVTAEECLSEMSSVIAVTEAIQLIFLPNLFTPNTNGTNDGFRVRGEGIAQIEFRIFDVSGREVYNTADVIDATQTGWDGKYQGNNLPSGTYTWTLRGSYVNGQPLTNSRNQYGQVMLVR